MVYFIIDCKTRAGHRGVLAKKSCRVTHQDQDTCVEIKKNGYILDAPIYSSTPLLGAEIQIEKDRTGDTGQTDIEQGTPDRQTDRHRTPDADELKFDKNTILKIMKYH